MTLALDGRDFKAASGRDTPAAGVEGTAETALRPAGIARIDDRRVDVVSAGEWIEAGARIRVVRSAGARVEVVTAGGSARKETP